MTISDVPNISKVIVLTRAELLYLMDAIGATHLAGMDVKEFDLPVSRRKKILQTGRQSLEERVLINKKTLAIDPLLADMVMAISFRERAIVLIRGIRGIGRQLFTFNIYGNTFVQHTLPEEGVHRLEKIASGRDILDYIDHLVMLRPVSKDHRLKYPISLKDFQQIQNLVFSEKVKALQHLISLGLPDEKALLMVETLMHPIFTLSLACLEIKKDKIENATSYSIFASEEASWGIWPGKLIDEEPELMIFSADKDDVHSMLFDWLNLGVKQENMDVSISKKKTIGAEK